MKCHLLFVRKISATKPERKSWEDPKIGSPQEKGTKNTTEPALSEDCRDEGDVLSFKKKGKFYLFCHHYYFHPISVYKRAHIRFLREKISRIRRSSSFKTQQFISWTVKEKGRKFVILSISLPSQSASFPTRKREKETSFRSYWFCGFQKVWIKAKISRQCGWACL